GPGHLGWIIERRSRGGMPGMFLRKETSGDVHRAARDVAVHVDAARHDDHGACVEPRCGIGQGSDDASILDADVAHFAVDVVRGIVHRPAGYPELAHVPNAPDSALAAARPSSSRRLMPDAT